MLCGSRLVSPREILSGRIGVIHGTPAVRQCSDLPPPGAQHRGGLFRREEDPFASPCLAQLEILGHSGRVTKEWMRHGGCFGGAEHRLSPQDARILLLCAGTPQPIRAK